MAETTIEWTATFKDGVKYSGFTFNPWIGCTKVHAGCTNCYAERDMDHRRHRAKWGPAGERVVTAEAYWNNPLKWDRQAKELGVRLKVFCASLADVFEDWTGPMSRFHNGQQFYLGKDFRASSGEETRATMQDVRVRLFKLIRATPNLDWLLLTKRPENIRKFWPDARRAPTDDDYRGWHGDGPIDFVECKAKLDNVWIGTSVSEQRHVEEQLPHLVNVKDLCKFTFLSVEPLLGPVDLTQNLPDERMLRWVNPMVRMVDWVIVGGESGPDARPTHWRWSWSLRDQCNLAGVPFFYKQHGEWQSGLKAPLDYTEGATSYRPGCYHDFGGDTMALRVGKKQAGRLLAGRTWDEMPA